MYQEHVELHENVCSAIQTSEHENNITILVGHESLIPWIAQLLNVNCIVVSSSESTIPISKKKGTRTHFIHSHISILNQSKFLLGDDRYVLLSFLLLIHGSKYIYIKLLHSLYGIGKKPQKTVNL